MMVDLEILKACGTDNDALKRLFTCKAPTEQEEMTPKERDAAKTMFERQRCIRDRISRRLIEAMYFSLKNYSFYSAIDMAWEPPPLAKKFFPLVQYAQGRIDVSKCASQLNLLGSCAQSFVKKDAEGKPVDIDIPKFTEVVVGLMRSVITRRVAAQSNKYNNLFPYFKYESRAVSEVGRLRSDLFSQRVDIMADQYGYKHHDTQVYRDAMLYGHSVDFIRAAWEKDLTWQVRPKAEGDESKEVQMDSVIAREGLAWITPHPTRVYWDNAYPLAQLNDDIGPEFVGFWDVQRYRDVAENMKYWNRSGIGYNVQYSQIFSTFTDYFSQYYCTITPPKEPAILADQVAQNDRVNLIGLYSQDQPDSSIVVANHFEKIVPIEYGLGTYPYPVWVRYVVASHDSVVYAEWLPSTPASVMSYNEKDDRQVNLGMGHELLPYQDQLTNLLSALLLSLKSDNIKVLIVDVDVLSEEQLKALRAEAKAGRLYTETHVLEVSRKKLNDMGLKPEDCVKLVETTGVAQITYIFQAILQLLNIVQQLQALSPQEQGQPAPREISATETNLIAGTTESVYNFISDAIDEFRGSKKRILYESWLNFGDNLFRLPVIDQYDPRTIKAAGLEMVVEDGLPLAGGQRFGGTIIGSKQKLIHDYVFTSRDGAERTSNAQTSKYLTEGLKALIPLPAFQESLTKGQFKQIVNEFFRMTGAFDVRLQPSQDDDEPLSPAADQELQQTLLVMTQQLEMNTKQLAEMQQAMVKSGLIPPQAQQGQPNGQPAIGNGNPGAPINPASASAGNAPAFSAVAA